MIYIFAAVTVAFQSEPSIEETSETVSVCVVLGISMLDRTLEFLVTPIADGTAIGTRST